MCGLIEGENRRSREGSEKVLGSCTTSLLSAEVCVVRKQVFRGRYSVVGGVATGVKRGAPMYEGGKEMKCNETDDANGQPDAFFVYWTPLL